MMKLQPIQIPQLKKVADALRSEDFEVRIVGGAVRDMILGETPKDVDLCTDATPDEMMAVGKAAGFTVVPTGIQHGTVTFVVDGIPFEITTLRIDTDTDGRHANVQFTRAFDVDAARRDLTINAMSMDFEGTVYDYFGGIEDLNAGRVRFVGDARKRVEEDYLRILRYFRFATRFGCEMDDDTLVIFCEPEIHEGLKKISRERYWLEMSKLLAMPNCTRVLKVMEATGILETIGLPANDHSGHIWADMADDACSAVAQFFVGHPHQALNFCQEWRMSAAERDKIVWLVSNYWENLTTEAIEDWLVHGTPRDWVMSLCSMHHVNGEMRDFAAAYDPPVFPVRGQDLLDAGMRPGAMIGQKLAAMKSIWVDSRFMRTKEELLNAVC
jgi:tRNA nucleotidyltransferase/poly(A) polymerase